MQRGLKAQFILFALSARLKPCPCYRARGFELHEAFADQVEGLLGGVVSYSGAVAAEGFFQALGFVAVAEGDVDEACGF